MSDYPLPASLVCHVRSRYYDFRLAPPPSVLLSRCRSATDVDTLCRNAERYGLVWLARDLRVLSRF